MSGAEKLGKGLREVRQAGRVRGLLGYELGNSGGESQVVIIVARGFVCVCLHHFAEELVHVTQTILVKRPVRGDDFALEVRV